MSDTEVLVLHGSPGAGKSTLAAAMSEALREADVAHAVIDLDELSLVHPFQGPEFARANLAAMWPNFQRIPGLKVIVPTVISDAAGLELLRQAMPSATFQVCELVAPKEVLEERVTAREPNEYWQDRLRNWVSLYHGRTDHSAIRDFQVSTHGRSVSEAVQDVLDKSNWLAPPQSLPHRNSSAARSQNSFPELS